MHKETIIKLSKKPNHINEFLTHWTGRNREDSIAFDNLSKIVDSGELKFSSHKISFPSSTYTISGQMICFTDTPVKQSIDHCNRYNYFGVSFNKAELIEYGANPVLYLVDNRQKHQDIVQDIRPFENEKRSLVSWVSSILQPYDSKQFANDNWAEFYEREWRIVRILPYPWINTAEKFQGPFNEYSFKGNIRIVNKNTKPGDEEFFLAFDKKIIENIIVPLNYKDRGRDLIKRNNLQCELIIIDK